MARSNQITVQIAEDQEITRFGLKCALEAFPNLKVVAESADGEAAVTDALSSKPDVILMDIGLPKLDGIQASKRIKDALPNTRIIMFTSFDNEDAVYAALGAGADGYCLKNVAADHLNSAIEAVSKGVAWLDPGIAERVLRSRHLQRETVDASAQKAVKAGIGTLTQSQMLILQLLSQGADLNEVAKRFDLSPETVAEHVNATIAKLYTSAASHNLQSPTLAVEAPPPTMIGDRYSIESVLGRGGMGIVYKGRHLLMDRLVAIKLLHPEYAADEQTARRFLSEAKSLSAVSHPNLVNVFDFGMTPAKEPYMVMEYHDGKGLDDVTKELSTKGLPATIDIFAQVCDALTGVHERNIVHRDIKPSNILIAENGIVKLVDFGIAKSLDNKSSDLTICGEVVGTPRYMSPEQCTGKALDARSDIYALGCVMYEFFTGKTPFDADSFYEMVEKHLHETPSRVPFNKLLVSVPREVEAIIFQALEKDPSKRQQSAALLKKDLLAVPLRDKVVS